MTLDIAKFKAVAETAKSRTSDRRWQAAINKAVAGVESGWWVITELASSVAVTTETGKTYFANGVCQCRAYELGQPCKHRSLYRLLALYNEAEKETVAVAVSPARYCGGRDLQHLDSCKSHVQAPRSDKSDKPRTTAATRRAPRVTRGVERDHAGNRFAVVRCEGWMI